MLGQSARKQDQTGSEEAQNPKKCMSKGTSGGHPLQPLTQSRENFKAGSGCITIAKLKN